MERQHLGFLFRGGILAATLIFLAKTLLKNWQEVSSLHLQSQAWLYGGVALGIALLAQLCAAFVWGWILEALQHPVPRRWSIVVFLKNTPAKYIPGSVWHLYGRVMAAQKKGITLELATLSVILEPLFVIAAALGLALLNGPHPRLQGLSLGIILLGVHPRILNLLWQRVNQVRGKQLSSVRLQHYPLRVLLGETAFMGLRGITFLLIVLAFTPLSWAALRPLMGGFSFAWLVGLVLPVSPGGIGVFEATAIALLDGILTPGVLLGAVAVYRLVSILAEIIGAALAYLVKEDKEKYSLLLSK
jgi:hypothetical protein